MGLTWSRFFGDPVEPLIGHFSVPKNLLECLYVHPVFLRKGAPFVHQFAPSYYDLKLLENLVWKMPFEVVQVIADDLMAVRIIVRGDVINRRIKRVTPSGVHIWISVFLLKNHLGSRESALPLLLLNQFP